MKSNAIDIPVLIIGYGNVLRRDDGVGWAAARRLIDQLPGTTAKVWMVPQLLPELAEPMSRSELVIFIDADAKLGAGQIQRRILRSPRRKNTQTIGHHQSPEGLIQMARDLYGRRPRALLFSIGGADFSFGCTLSSAVKTAVRKVVSDVVDAVMALSPKTGCCHA